MLIVILSWGAAFVAGALAIAQFGAAHTVTYDSPEPIGPGGLVLALAALAVVLFLIGFAQAARIMHLFSTPGRDSSPRPQRRR